MAVDRDGLICDGATGATRVSPHLYSHNAGVYEQFTNSLCELYVACFLMVCTHESHQPANSEGCKSRGCCDDTDADPSPGSRLYSFAFSRRPHVCIPPARHERLDSVAGSSQRQATQRSRRRLLEDSPVSRTAIERVAEPCRLPSDVQFSRTRHREHPRRSNRGIPLRSYPKTQICSEVVSCG